MSLGVSSSSDDASCAGSVCEGYPPTPVGSEVDLLEYYENIAHWLYAGNCTGTIGIWKSNYWKQMMDSVPGAGEYYRALVQRHPMRDVVLMRYGAFLSGQAAREHNEKQNAENERSKKNKKCKSTWR
jgi:hypothetical protein